jgi:hypothetical protein
MQRAGGTEQNAESRRLNSRRMKPMRTSRDQRAGVSETEQEVVSYRQRANKLRKA